MSTTIALDHLAAGSPAPQENNLRRLAAAVLPQAVRDAAGRNQEHRVYAEWWLLEDTESFPAWCEAAGLDWRQVELG